MVLPSPGKTTVPLIIDRHEMASFLHRPLASCCSPFASVTMRLREIWRMMQIA